MLRPLTFKPGVIGIRTSQKQYKSNIQYHSQLQGVTGEEAVG